MICNKNIEEAATMASISDTEKGRVREGYVINALADHENGFREGYIEGAKWAINEFSKDLWHQTDEEPKGYDEWILLHYNVGNYYSLAQVKDFKSWKGFVERAPIEKWLYIDDLFPKEGGEQ